MIFKMLFQISIFLPPVSQLLQLAAESRGNSSQRQSDKKNTDPSPTFSHSSSGGLDSLHLRMQFITGINRYQTYFGKLEELVAPGNSVPLIDAFIDKLDLAKLGFKDTVHKSEDRPPYAPQILLKLY